jgi:SAM-dependent methyltransferase
MASMNEPLPFTGERFIPGAAGEIWYEHWHRYHFVTPLVAGREVLDIACGEGYGSALLAAHAARVTGADIAATAVAHARARYASRPNLEFREADCAALPFADASFDVVVSFETLEHIEGQEAFLDEVRRVLRPTGFVVLSCPNKAEYSDKRDHINEFHYRELYRDELAALVGARFPHVEWYGQRPGFFSVVWPEQSPASAEIFEVSEDSADAPTPGHARPLYFIVVAGGDGEAIAGLPRHMSVLADRDEWVYRDYEKVTRAYIAGQKAESDLIADLRRELAAVESGRIDDVRQRDRVIADGCATRDRLVEEIARRASFRWWITLPWRRLARALKGLAPGG